ncbi:hypothetical protein TrVE_jg2426 [Triparma verrucosa]|uniref:Glutaredoxin domain-containing protein n=2 Tax=Triparma TaxID=722752 RepID=A0A9W7E6J2_9STRA|nr:hypothetical protein TrST_g12406 [Triparma strigata]GMI06153.1 hypothetical protein TrVE_jg2426 [Triparma verrucosa]
MYRFTILTIAIMTLLSLVSRSQAFAPGLLRVLTPIAGSAFSSVSAQANSQQQRTCSSLSMSGLPATDYISKALEENEVVVFSKSFCPFCTSTKKMFSETGTELGMTSPAFVVELDQIDGGADIQAELLSQTGQRTVPNVFVKGKHVGGNDDTMRAAANGKLQEMLK